MAFPYAHCNRAQGKDCIELHKRGTDSGTGISVSGTFSDSYDVNLPYNEWNVHGVFWAQNIDQDLTLQVIPYIDHAQTINGPAFFLSQPGSTAAASAITLSATATGSAGALFLVLGGISGGGVTTQQWGGISPVHGMKVVVSTTDTVATTNATMDWELVGIPGA